MCECVCVGVFIGVCVCVCPHSDHSPGEHVEWGWRGNQTRFLDAVLRGPDGALYSSLAVQLLSTQHINIRARINTYAHAGVRTCIGTHTHTLTLFPLSVCQNRAFLFRRTGFPRHTHLPDRQQYSQMKDRSFLFLYPPLHHDSLSFFSLSFQHSTHTLNQNHYSDFLSFLQAIIYEGQDKNPEMCRVLLTHEIMCR